MKKNSISSAAVFPKLRNILNQDIDVLTSIRNNRETDTDEYGLLDSLIDAKYKIIDILPGDGGGVAETAQPPQRLHIVGYEDKSSDSISNLVSMLYDIEKDQMKFVQDNVADEGMPDDLAKKLRGILDIYQVITDQLDRSQKTNQYNAIVL